MKLHTKGFILTEVILSITLLGIAVVPLMTMFVLSANINQESSSELKSFLEAQQYMEEIKASDRIDFSIYSYNSQIGYYERNVVQEDEKFGATIKIIPQSSVLYSIEIYIKDKGEIINSLIGTKLIK